MEGNGPQFFHARSRARRLAMQALYQWQITGADINEIAGQFREDENYDKVDKKHFKALLDAAERREFDSKIEACMDMSIDKIDPIERAIICNAAYEIACCSDIDSAVTITEAVHLAKKFGGENSYKFVNGVLDCFADRQSPEGEAGLIKKYFDKPRGEGVVLGIGDDAAVIDKIDGNLVVSTDTMVEGTHFKKEDDGGDVGYKALAVALSDLAAMGAVPKWALLTVTLPAYDEQWVQRFADGFFTVAKKYGVGLIGGDISRGQLSVTVQVLGLVQSKYMSRDGARAGQGIYVTGAVAATALAALHADSISKCGSQSMEQCLERQKRPDPRVDAAQIIAQYASAAIDISDGILIDLSRVLSASKIGATVEIQDLPFVDGYQRCCPDADSLLKALSYGEDYELLFVMDTEHYPSLEKKLSDTPTAITHIAMAEKEPGLRCTFGSEPVTLPDPLGYDHFTQ